VWWLTPALSPSGAVVIQTISSNTVDFLTPNSTTADGDLRYRALLLCQGIINAHDEHNSFLPFFYIDVRDGKLCCQHSSWALDDSIFRNISALARVYKITGRAELLPHLRHMIASAERSLDIGDGVNAADDRALMHNMSRGLMALSAMAEIDDRALWTARLDRFITRLMEIYSTPGWETGQEYVLATKSWRSHEASPATCGRTIVGLVRCYKITHDERAIELARRFIRVNLACFDDAGQPQESAGVHFHSIADTLQGILSYAELTEDRALIEKCELIYRKGLKSHGVDATGWFAEHIHHENASGCDVLSNCFSGDLRTGGEICCTANMISCAILLGRAGYAHAFEDAERWIRNMLFASQLLDLSTVNISATDEPRWPDFQQRLIGNVAGFPSSNAAYDPTSPHLTQLCCPAQAAESLCDAWESAAISTASDLNVNLFFSSDIVTSHLPRTGNIIITPKKNTAVRIKTPSWSPPDAYKLRIGPRRVDAIAAMNTDGYLYLGHCRAGEPIEFRFDLPHYKTTESHSLQPAVNFHWRGNTIVDCHPRSDLLPLFADRADLKKKPVPKRHRICKPTV